MKPGPVPVCVGQFGGGAAIAEPLAAKIAAAEQAASSAGVDFPPRKFIVSPAQFAGCKKIRYHERTRLARAARAARSASFKIGAFSYQ